jgi:acyl-CoA thioesterase I
VSPVALYFISGDSLYSGSVLLLLAIAASPFLTNRRMLIARNVIAWLAVALMVVACPPFSWSAYIAFLASFVVWFLASNAAIRASRSALSILLFLLVLALSASEFARRRMPAITGVTSDHLAVIGDSISAGMDAQTPAWPAVFQQMTGVAVNNCSKPGTLVADGVALADRVTEDDRIVLIEIGGNDLLSGTPSREFDQNLNSLISKLHAPGRTIVMFELPLLPNRIEYGRIQRRLASQYHVWLIPKHYFVAVIGGTDATLDGLHLSSKGALQMAFLVNWALSPILKAPVSSLRSN